MTLALRSVHMDRAPSPRLLQALAPFSLVVLRDRCQLPEQKLRSTMLHHSTRSDHQLRTLLDMPDHSIALLTGPSGCGKSTLINAFAFRLRHATRRSPSPLVDAQHCFEAIDPKTPIVDLFSSSIPETLKLLGAAGLGEAMLWARSASELSQGQRARLMIALAIATATPRAQRMPVWIVIDEFASTLDRVTACNIARTLRMWSRRLGHVRIICASAHEDIIDPLEPDLLIEPQAQHAAPGDTHL